MDDMRDCGHVLVVDDDAPLRALLISILTRAGFATDEARTGAEAIQAVRDDRPDAVVLDVCLPDANGLELCHELREEHGDDLKVLFVSGERVDSFARVAGFLAGADDYLVKPFDPDELIARVRRLVRRTAPTSTRPSEAHELTPRELEVLQLLAHGRPPAEIAAALTISAKTVATHLHRVLGKLGVHSRAHAVARAYGLGIIAPEADRQRQNDFAGHALRRTGANDGLLPTTA
jgi:DNA-binding response OmpR family regulator